MITRINKVKLTVIMLLTAVLMFTGFLFLQVAPKASAVTTGDFVMSDTIEARISDPSGLRFTVYMSEATKEAIDSEDVEIGFVVAPAENIRIAGGNYLDMGEDASLVIPVDESKITAVKDVEGRYYVNAVLYNILDQNWDLKFSAVAYYKNTGTGSVVYADNIHAGASISEIAREKFFAEENNAEIRKQISEGLNFGATEIKTVDGFKFGLDVNEDGVVDENDVYEVEPHKIGINTEQFKTIAKYTYDEDNDANYSFKLLEDVDLGLTENVGTIFDVNFKAHIDGDGYKISYSIYSPDGWGRGLFYGFYGSIKNAVIKSDVNLAYGTGASFAWDFGGVIENCVFDFDYKSPTHIESVPSGYETSISTGIVHNMYTGSLAKDVVIFDRGLGIHKFFAVAGQINSTIDGMVYVGENYNKTSSWWRRLPEWTGEESMTINNFYMYPNLQSAYMGTGRYVNETYNTTISSATNKDNSGWYTSFTGFGLNAENIVEDKFDSATTVFSSYLKDRATADQRHYSIFFGGREVVAGQDVDVIYSSTATELYTNITNNKSAEHVLASDVHITDDQLDPENFVVAQHGKLFDTFSGVLDGNGNTLTISVLSSSYGYKAFNTLSGVIKDISVVLSTRAVHNGARYGGVFVGTLNGGVENCIVSSLHTAAPGAAGYGYNTIVGTLGANGQIKNSILVDSANSYIADGVFYDANATSKIKNVAVVSDSLVSNNATIKNYLPNTKCDVEGFYLYGSFDKAISGVADYVLDVEKYADASTPANPASTSSSDVAVLYGGSEEKALKDIVGGKDVAFFNAPIYNVNGASTMKAFRFFDASLVTVELDQSSLVLNEKSPATTLSATVTYKGNPVDSSEVVWASDNQDVVTVANGVVTVVGAGEATVIATYGGASASCEITVEEYFEEITSGADFVTKIKANPSGKFKLMNDITINDNNVSPDDYQFTANAYVINDFSGKLYGNNHTIKFNAAHGATSGYPAYYGMFNTISGLISDVNFILAVRSQSSNNAGTFALTLNGTVENCIISYNRDMIGGGYGYVNLIGTMGANAVFQNNVVERLNTGHTYYIIVRSASETSLIKNIAVLNAAGWADASGNAIENGASRLLPISKANIDGLYLFNSKADLLAGTYAWKLNEENYKASSAEHSYYYMNVGTAMSTLFDSYAGTPVDVSAMLGHKLVLKNETVKTATYSKTDNVYTVTERSYVVLDMYDTAPTDVVVSIDSELALTDKSSATQLNVTVTKGGVAVDSALYSWSLSNEGVVTVSETGLVTVVGTGSVTITLTYYGIASTCVVTVTEHWDEISTAEQFINYMTNAPDGKYKLINDIVITDTSLDANSTFQSKGSFFANDFTGVIDGNKYSVTFNINTRVGNVTHYYIFNKVSGVFKNINVVINLDTYYRAGHTGFFIDTLKGTIENSVISYDTSKYGNYGYPSLIRSLDAGSKVENTVINMVGNSYRAYVIAEAADATAVLNNIYVISGRLGAEGGVCYNLGVLLPSQKCQITNVHAFSSIANAISGKTYASLNNDKYAAEDAPANITWKSGDSSTDNLLVLYDQGIVPVMTDVLGYNIVSKTIIVPKATFSGGAITEVVQTEINVVDFAD